MIFKSQKNILLIDENEDHLELELDAISASDIACDIKGVPSSKKAKDYLLYKITKSFSGISNKPNLIFLDANKPKIDGFKLLEWLKSNNRLNGIPVILLATSFNKEDIKKGTELGAYDYIEKPLTPENVKEKLLKMGFISKIR